MVSNHTSSMGDIYGDGGTGMGLRGRVELPARRRPSILPGPQPRFPGARDLPRARVSLSYRDARTRHGLPFFHQLACWRAAPIVRMRVRAQRLTMNRRERDVRDLAWSQPDCRLGGGIAVARAHRVSARRGRRRRGHRETRSARGLVERCLVPSSCLRLRTGRPPRDEHELAQAGSRAPHQSEPLRRAAARGTPPAGLLGHPALVTSVRGLRSGRGDRCSGVRSDARCVRRPAPRARSGRSSACCAEFRW